MEYLAEIASLQLLLVIGVITIVLIPLVLTRWAPDQRNPVKQGKDLDTAEPSQLNIYQPARVCEVIDGCRVIVNSRGSRLTLRLDSIDSHEPRMGYGDASKAGLVKLIEGQDIVFENHGVDSTGRTLATVFVVQDSHWINVNSRMIKLGLAWIMRDFYQHLSDERQDEMRRMERYAQSRSLGIWVEPEQVSQAVVCKGQ